MRRVCAAIEENDEQPLTLKKLSASTGLSAHHLQRTFKEVMGITPRQYAESRRLTQFKANVKSGASVTAAMYDAGYGSSRGLYENPNASIDSKDTAISPSLNLWLNQVLEHLNRKTPRIDLPLDIRATAFQWRVWDELRQIPLGATRSYQQIANAIGKPKAVRAVARACASNHAALVIPCHRVVREDKTLGGYRWGLERKRKLLDAEERALTS